MSNATGARLMAGYTKLFSTIVHSTVWREEKHIKVVWITMLALANRNGIVEASIPGLADASRVTLQECEEALAKLSAPDSYSRTKEHQGRRISECSGGWQIINYLKYRELLNKDEERIKTRDRVAKHREKKRNSVTVTDGNAPLQQAEATTNYQLPTSNDNGLAATPSESVAVVVVKPKAWTHEACDDWTERFGGTAPGGKIMGALAPLIVKHAWTEVRPSWRRYLAEREPDYSSAQDFASHYGLWSGAKSKNGKTPLSQDPAVQAFLRGSIK